MRELKRPGTLQDALKMDGVFLSGGTECLRLNSGVAEKEPLIDILPLLDSGIRKDGREVSIGAGATFADLIESPLVPECLKRALRYMQSPELRNAATIAGNIGAKRDDSYLIPTLAASGAKLSVMTPDGEAVCSIREFMELQKALITSIVIDCNAEVRQFRESRTSHAHAIVTLAEGDSLCYAVKGSGIFFDRNISYASDMYGSAEYKKYLVDLFIGGSL